LLTNNEEHAKRANINVEGAQTCSRVNEAKILFQVEINEGSSAGHKGWAECEESHHAHLSEAGRVGASAGSVLEVARRKGFERL